MNGATRWFNCYTSRLPLAHVNYLNMFLLPPFTPQHKQSQMGYTLIIEVNLNGTIDKVD